MIFLVIFVFTLLALGIWRLRFTGSRYTLDGPERLLAVAVRLLPKERSDWGAAMLGELEQLQNPFTRWQFAVGCAQVALFPPRRGGSIQTYRSHTMKNITDNPRAAALIGFLLPLPLTLLLSILWFEIEPFQGFLKHWFTESDGVGMNALAQIVMMGSVLLLPVALIINLATIARNVRVGNSVMTNPMNLLLTVVLFAFITTIAGVFVIDQYPCWIGVPNCD